MISVLGLVWGSFLFLLVLAISDERRSAQDTEDGTF